MIRRPRLRYEQEMLTVLVEEFEVPFDRISLNKLAHYTWEFVVTGPCPKFQERKDAVRMRLEFLKSAWSIVQCRLDGYPKTRFERV